MNDDYEHKFNIRKVFRSLGVIEEHGAWCDLQLKSGYRKKRTVMKAFLAKRLV